MTRWKLSHLAQALGLAHPSSGTRRGPLLRMESYEEVLCAAIESLEQFLSNGEIILTTCKMQLAHAKEGQSQEYGDAPISARHKNNSDVPDRRGSGAITVRQGSTSGTVRRSSFGRRLSAFQNNGSSLSKLKRNSVLQGAPNASFPAPRDRNYAPEFSMTPTAYRFAQMRAEVDDEWQVGEGSFAFRMCTLARTKPNKSW